MSSFVGYHVALYTPFHSPTFNDFLKDSHSISLSLISGIIIFIGYLATGFIGTKKTH
jgi:hypothetical protein